MVQIEDTGVSSQHTAKKHKPNPVDDESIDDADIETVDSAIINLSPLEAFTFLTSPGNCQRAEYSFLLGAVLKSNLDEIFSALDSTYQKFACSLSNLSWPQYMEKVIPTMTISEKYAFRIPTSDLDAWTPTEKFYEKIDELVLAGSILPCYGFDDAGADSDDSDSETRLLACTADIGGDSLCYGELRITRLWKSGFIVFEHAHKHHFDRVDFLPPECPSDSLIEKGLIASMGSSSMKAILQDHYEKLLEHQERNAARLDLAIDPVQPDGDKERIISMIKRMHWDFPTEKIEQHFDYYFKLYVPNSKSVWDSTISFFNTHRFDYAYFLFYQGGLMGLAVIFKNIVAILPKKIDSVAIYSPTKCPGQKFSIMSASANINGRAFPLGYMVISNVEDVKNDIFSRKNLTDDQKAFPIPRCRIACILDFFSTKEFSEEYKALVSSFFSLFHGTETELYADRSEYDHVRSSYLGKCAQLDRDVKMNRFHGLEIPLFIIDNDFPILRDVVRFTHPSARVKNSSKYIEYIFNKSIPHIIPPSDPVIFLRESKIIKDPKRIYEIPHFKAHCRHRSQPDFSGIQCFQCFPRPSLHLPRPKFERGEFFPEDSKYIGCTFALLFDLLSDYAQMTPMLPQSFSHLSEFSGQPNEAKYYTLKTLYQKTLKDLFVFCNKYNLLGILDYLWCHLFSPKEFEAWTQCLNVLYEPPSPNGASDVFSSLYTPKYRERNPESLQLVERINGFHNFAYPGYLRKLKELIRDEPLGLSIKSHSFVMKRSTTAKSLIRFSPSKPGEIPSTAYQRDCEKFGTDVVMFVCGCREYKKAGFHLCMHIARGITRESLASFADPELCKDVRAMKTPPFYVPSTSGLEDVVPDSLWPILAFDPGYVNFWKHTGRSIIELKGGRRAETVFPPKVSDKTKVALTTYLESTALSSSASDSPSVFPPMENLLLIDEELGESEIKTACLNCIPQQNQIYIDDVYHLVGFRHFLRFADDILRFEIKRLVYTLAHATVAEDLICPMKASDDVLDDIPLKNRTLFIRKAQELGVYEDKTSDAYRTHISEISQNYTRLYTDSMIL